MIKKFLLFFACLALFSHQQSLVAETVLSQSIESHLTLSYSLTDEELIYSFNLSDGYQFEQAASSNNSEIEQTASFTLSTQPNIRLLSWITFIEKNVIFKVNFSQTDSNKLQGFLDALIEIVDQGIFTKTTSTQRFETDFDLSNIVIDFSQSPKFQLDETKSIMEVHFQLLFPVDLSLINDFSISDLSIEESSTENPLVENEPVEDLLVQNNFLEEDFSSEDNSVESSSLEEISSGDYSIESTSEEKAVKDDNDDEQENEKNNDEQVISH